jgi:hypothetical protein
VLGVRAVCVLIRTAGRRPCAWQTTPAEPAATCCSRLLTARVLAQRLVYVQFVCLFEQQVRTLAHVAGHLQPQQQSVTMAMLRHSSATQGTFCTARASRESSAAASDMLLDLPCLWLLQGSTLQAADDSLAVQQQHRSPSALLPCWPVLPAHAPRASCQCLAAHGTAHRGAGSRQTSRRVQGRAAVGRSSP